MSNGINATATQDFKITPIESAENITKFEIEPPSQLTTIPVAIFDTFPNLEDLCLNSAGINNLTSDRFENATNLLNIYLKGNSIESIPTAVFANASKLETLDLSENRIETVAENSFEGLVFLNTLDLSNNNITLLKRHTFSGAPKLAYLHLVFNLIEAIEEGAFDLPNLSEIYLKSNRIQNLPASVFAQTPFLKEVDLGNNRLASVGEIFKNCSELHTIALGSNIIKDVNLSSFSLLPSLAYLSLENTGVRLSDAANVTEKSNSSVVYLNLSSNNLSDPDIFRKLTMFGRLEELQLVNNNFSEFNDHKEIAKWFPNFYYLVVVDNYNLVGKWMKENGDIFRIMNITTVLNYDID